MATSCCAQNRSRENSILYTRALLWLMVIIYPVKLGVLDREQRRLKIIAVFTQEPTTCPILSQMNPDCTFSSCFCRTYFNATHLSTSGSSNCSVSIRLLHWNDVFLSLLSFTCCMTWPSHSSCDTQIMFVRSTNHEALHYALFSSLLLLPFSLTEYFLKHPVLEHPQHTFSLNVRDQVSHPYNTTGKIIVLYILAFFFLGSRQEHKSFCTKCYQAFPEFLMVLMSSCM